MIEYSTLVEYLNDEYPYSDDLFGLVLDLVNGVTSPKELKLKVKEYKEHN